MQIKKLTAVIAIAFLIVFSFVGCKNKGNTSSDSSGTVSSKPSVSSDDTPVSSDSSTVSSDVSSVASKPHNNVSSEPRNNSSSEPHKHAYKITRVNPTCTEDGYTLYECSCGRWYTEKSKKKTGHKWGDWKESVIATAFDEGKKERICTVCGYKETKTVEKLKPEELEKELLKLINEARTEAGIEVLEQPMNENAAKLAEYLALGKTDEYEAELAKLNAEHSGKCQISGNDTAQKAFEALQADENHKKDILGSEYKWISLKTIVDGENIHWALVLWG
mgnify:FL=1